MFLSLAREMTLQSWKICPPVASRLFSGLPPGSWILREGLEPSACLVPAGFASWWFSGRGDGVVFMSHTAIFWGIALMASCSSVRAHAPNQSELCLPHWAYSKS